MGRKNSRKTNGSKYWNKRQEQRAGLRPRFGSASEINGSASTRTAKNGEGLQETRSQQSSAPSAYDIFDGSVQHIVTLAYLGGENVPLQKPSLWDFPSEYIPAVEERKTRPTYLDAQENGGRWTIRRISGFAEQETGRAIVEGSHIDVARLLSDWSAVAGAHPQNTASQQQHMKKLGPETAYVDRNNFRAARELRLSRRGLAY